MSEKNPKLLFLACPFPPYPAIGAVRTWNIARDLVRLGWNVTVVTPDPSVWRHPEDVEETDVRIRRAGIQRILTDHSWRCLDPEILNCRNQGLSWIIGGVCRQVARRLGIDSWVSWVRTSERACSTLVPNDVDVILATGSPFASFSLAKRLADKLGRPYVLDYRDPWTGNPHDEHSNRRGIVRKEAALLAGSAAITIVSPSWASALDRRFGVGTKLHVITNGYDPEEIEKVKPYDFGHFAIVYTGGFYPPKRVISPIMAALNQLKKTSFHREWKFHYFGHQADHVREEARRFDTLDRVVIHGMVPRHQALSAVRGSGMAVVITTVEDSVDVQDKGIIPGKLFETIGLGSPTVVIAPVESDVEAIVGKSGRARRFSGRELGGISSFIAEVMRGGPPPARNPDLYTWKAISKRVDSILRTVAGHTSPLSDVKLNPIMTVSGLS